MACVHVVADGGIALPPGAANDYGIRIVPRPMIFGGKEVTLGAPTDLQSFLAIADSGSEPVAFAPGNPEQFRSVYAEIVGWGVEVLSLHGPAALGGSAAAAREAVAGLGADTPVTVLETPWTSGLLGLLALRAAILGQDEIPRDQLADLVRTSGSASGFLLVGSGPEAAGRAGADGSSAPSKSALPILSLQDGRMAVVGGAGSIGEALRSLADAVTEEIGGAETGTHVAVMSAGADAEAAALATFLESRLYPSEIWIGPADAASAAIGGRGAFGVAFYADKSEG